MLLNRITKVLLILFVYFISLTANAQWSSDPTINTAICTTIGEQKASQVISDGSGSYIFAWYDNRNGINNYDIYVQKIDANGAIQWITDGVAICTATNSQYEPKITTDDSGGAIISWVDYRNGSADIYIQRVNSSGVAQWTADGVAICSSIGDQVYQELISDGAGGAIITWDDQRSGTDDIYAQRVNSNGVTQWTADGVAICTAINSQGSPRLISDGLGGAIITWIDSRHNPSSVVYGQRINSSGTVQWTADGVAFSPIGLQVGSNPPHLISDDLGGAIITWEKIFVGLHDIYAQRIDSNGALLWIADGVAICSAIREQHNPKIISDGSGGAIITWKDERIGPSTYDIYAQKINSNGLVQWTTDGVAICTANGQNSYTNLVSNGSGGAIFTWEDYRGLTRDIYAQRVNSNGVTQLTNDGVAICSAIGEQYNPNLISDGLGGAIITWEDYRSGSSYDIYAQKVNSEGMLGNSSVLTTTTITSITGTSATSGGNITSSGSSVVTARGVVWSTSPNPTIVLSTKSNDGVGSGVFTSSITGLSSGITYYVRAYATNSTGTSYGNEISFTTLSNEQVVESNAPNSGDGNNDGIQDSQQDNIFSIINKYTHKYITIVSLDGYAISGVEVLLPNDSKYYYPGSLVKFTIAHSSARVKIYYHDVTTLNGYSFKKLNTKNILFNFTNYTFGTEVINGNIVPTATLTLTDGGPEDNDGIVNGSITDPGGPAILASDASIPVWDWKYVVLLMSLFGVWLYKSKIV